MNQMNQYYNPTQQYQTASPQSSAQNLYYSQPTLPPQGMVFNINSSQELDTIPPSMGLNLYWCAPESKVYVRNFINGKLDTKEYYLSDQPIEEKIHKQNDDIINNILQRLSTLENNIKKGGTTEWQL